MPLKRLTAATLAMCAIAFGASVLAGSSRASGGAKVTYECLAADKQFVNTVATQLTQLSYWSAALQTHDAEPGVVVSQARNEAVQVDATRPGDRTLHASRDLISSMLKEYAKAVEATTDAKDGSAHMQNAWRLAAAAHKLLAGAQAGLAAKGCDVSRLMQS
ncbi:MAG TPA: hypothetical protein VFA56_00145 [Gaiellaceae bacterium]|nr:hypothetical protein [Gaiellaceae bacterium]